MILEYTSEEYAKFKPFRANPSDAGLDLPFNPENGNSIRIGPGESRLLDTGLRFAIPHGYMLEIKNRSGMAYKRSLIVGACVVDSGYDGKVFVNLHNIGKNIQFIEVGERIAQAVVIPVVHARFVEAENDINWYPITISERGEGALGSTDGKA